MIYNKKRIYYVVNILLENGSGINADQIVFNRISDGLTNQLYYCGLPDHVKTVSDEPREIALRLYGPKHFSI